MGISIGLCKNPLSVGGYYQYVAPFDWHFTQNGRNLGRIIWRRDNELEGLYIDKDE